MNNSIDIELYKRENPYWWSLKTRRKEFLCSDYLMEICGVCAEKVSFADFMMLVKPTHRNRVEMLFNGSVSSEEGGCTGVAFELLTKFGYRWVNMCGEQRADLMMVRLEFLSESQIRMICKDDDKLLFKESPQRYMNIYNILTELHHQKDISTVIVKILKGLIDTFQCDRAYLFEYDLEAGLQSCIYEEVAPGVESMIDKLQDLPMSYTQWFNKVILEENNPIIYNDIEELAEQAPIEYKILKDQNISSIFAMPFVNKEGAVGYIGIDIVNRKHTWSEADKLWFQSLANLMSLCITLKKSERKAKEERERYRDLYENMPTGLVKLKVVYDAHGEPVDYQLVEMNSIACNVFDVDLDDYKGSYGSLTKSHTPYFTKRLQKLGDILKSRQVHRETITIDNLNRYLDYTIFPVDRDSIVILFQDKTNTVTTSRALQKSEDMLEKIYKNIPVGIEIYDKQGALISLNDVEQEMFGYHDKESVLGINLFDNPNIPQFFLEDLKNGKASWCDFYYDFNNLNNYYISECKSKKHIVLKGLVLYDADNNVENYLLIVLDNTDTLKANHKIYEFESLFNSIAEFAEIGLSQWNLKNKTLYGTEQWHYNLCSQDMSTGDIMSVYGNVHKEDRTKLKQNFESMIAGEIKNFRQEIRVKNGDDWKWLRTNYKISEGDDGQEIVGINVDITEMKITEDSLIKAKSKAEESDQLKLSFLANMSHEIRTPLNVINGFSDLLVSIDDESEREQYSKIIKQNSDSLLQLISDILDLSKIDSGMADLFLEPVDLHGVCRDVIMLSKTKAVNDIEFVFEPQVEPCMVYSDSKRLAQVLTNLMSNASKFTKKGSVTLGYTVDEYEVKVYVRDTGLGINEEHKNKIFNRFVKLDEFVPGTGLGLSICQRLVEMLGGQIWLESTVGVGSCFYFTQPLNGVTRPIEPESEEIIVDEPEIVEELVVEKPIEVPIAPLVVPVASQKSAQMVTAPEVVAVSSSAVSASSTDKPVILVAEDTDSNYLLLSTMLKRDYTIYRANNGREAVDMFNKYSPAMVLMDIRMPIMDGLEATRLIKAVNVSVPIVVLTAFAYSDDRSRAAEAGCDGFLTKPVNYKELKEVIRLHLEK